MSYLLTGNASVQALSSGQDFQTLIKYSISALEVDSSLVIPVTLVASTPVTVPLTSIQKVQVVAVRSRSATPVEISLTQTSGVDVWVGLPSHFAMFVRTDSATITHLKLRSSVAARAEVTVAGKFT